jgi:hypothetical protein
MAGPQEWLAPRLYSRLRLFYSQYPPLSLMMMTQNSFLLRMFAYIYV